MTDQGITNNTDGPIDGVATAWYGSTVITVTGSGSGLEVDVYVDKSGVGDTSHVADHIVTAQGSGYVAGDIVDIIPAVAEWAEPYTPTATIYITGDDCPGPHGTGPDPSDPTGCGGGVVGTGGMITFIDRRQLRDGIRNCNLDYNFAHLVAGLQAGGIGPTGPAGADGVIGADGTDGADGAPGAASTVPGPQGPQGPAGVGGLGDRLDGGRSDSVYTADQSIIGGGA